MAGKIDIILLVISGISLAISIFKPLLLPFDAAWAAIILCGIPIKDDPESRKIYSITAGVGVVIVIGTIIKILVIGF